MDRSGSDDLQEVWRKIQAAAKRFIGGLAGKHVHTHFLTFSKNKIVE
jgi:hypothetical protein